jgi:iron complex transport system substrate-binding protein
MRLVSLLPSATEIVYALGLGDQLVGVTFECDEPPCARADKIVVVGGLDTRRMTPREIDEYVHGRLAAGGNLYSLHEHALAGLQPDLILTQDLCAVCALPSGQVEAALGYLGCHAQVLTLDPRTLEQVLGSILAVGQATAVAGRAGRLVAALRARLAAVASRVAGRPRPKVAVVEWVDPPFTAGHWVPDLVTAAGGTPVAAVPGRWAGDDQRTRPASRSSGRPPGPPGAGRSAGSARRRPGPAWPGRASPGTAAGAGWRI